MRRLTHAAGTEEERILGRIWEQVLGVRPIGVQDDFFALGGHSLLAVGVFAEMEQAFGKKLPLCTLFQSPTIRQVAAALRPDVAAARDSLMVGIQPHGSRPPFFWIHSLGGDGGGGVSTVPAAPAMGKEAADAGAAMSAERPRPETSLRWKVIVT